jgi:hypothetical protein
MKKVWKIYSKKIHDCGWRRWEEGSNKGEERVGL